MKTSHQCLLRWHNRCADPTCTCQHHEEFAISNSKRKVDEEIHHAATMKEWGERVIEDHTWSVGTEGWFDVEGRVEGDVPHNEIGRE